MRLRILFALLSLKGLQPLSQRLVIGFKLFNSLKQKQRQLVVTHCFITALVGRHKLR